MPIYPTLHCKTDSTTRAITLIKGSIKTDSWKQIDFPLCNITVIQLKGEWGKLTVVNVYNNCQNDETIRLLTNFHNSNQAEITQTNSGTAHILWVRDFNRYHPYWDDPRDTRLFTTEVTAAVEKLIEAIADIGLDLALPSGILTHMHNVTKLWSRLDQVFISNHSENLLILCIAQPDQRGVNMDHLPILTELNLKADVALEEEIHNFREVDWDEFCKELSTQLDKLPPPALIVNQRQLDTACDNLTTAIQHTIIKQVPVLIILPKSKRWWTKELTQL